MKTPLINFIASVAVVAATVPFSAQAAGLATSVLTAPSDTQHVQQIAFRKRAINKEKGARELKRLLNSHVGFRPITRDARAATGNPNIRVIDRRVGLNNVYKCSYIFMGGERTLICD